MLTYAIALVCDDAERERLSPGHGRGLTWLVGVDGNDSDWLLDEAAKQAQMLARRHGHVVVPAQDQMPGSVPDPYNDGTEKR